MHRILFTHHCAQVVLNNQYVNSLFCCNNQQELIKLRELSRFQEEHGHSFGRRERHDSTDSIEDSMEIKRLRSEISKLQTECQHWKSLANGVVSRKQRNVTYVCTWFVLVTWICLYQTCSSKLPFVFW